MKLEEIIKAAELGMAFIITFKAGKLWGMYKTAVLVKQCIDNGDMVIVTTEED